MLETSSRLLHLLSLLQSRPEWGSAELADELAITRRTVRRDVERLRELGYPINATRGAAGGYRLGPGRALPPLLLEEDEAVAVALGLQLGSSNRVDGLEEAGVSAQIKLRDLLPSRLHTRLDSLQFATELSRGANTSIPAAALTTLAEACHRHERLRFDYTSSSGEQSRREVEPYRLVSLDGRWYLLAWDLQREAWRSFRVDRLEPKLPAGPRFTPRDLPEGAASQMVFKAVTEALSKVRARVRFEAPADRIAERASSYGQRVEPDGPDACILSCGGDSVQTLAWWIGSFGVDFTVLDAPGVREQCEVLASRYRKAAADPDQS